MEKAQGLATGLIVATCVGAIVALVASGCGSFDCLRDSDCQTGEACLANWCTPVPAPASVAGDGGTVALPEDGGSFIASDGGEVIPSEDGGSVANDGGEVIPPAEDGGATPDGGEPIADGGEIIPVEDGGVPIGDGGEMPADGGAIVADGGQIEPTEDGGAPAEDGGAPTEDGGTVVPPANDGGEMTEDGGAVVDGGVIPAEDGGQPHDGGTDGGTTCVPTGPEVCDGVDNNCDGQTDEAVSCPGIQVCLNGTCQCPTGFTLCGGTCVSLSIDSDNCGACGNACADLYACQSSQCVRTHCEANVRVGEKVFNYTVPVGMPGTHLVLRGVRDWELGCTFQNIPGTNVSCILSGDTDMAQVAFFTPAADGGVATELAWNCNCWPQTSCWSVSPLTADNCPLSGYAHEGYEAQWTEQWNGANCVKQQTLLP